MWILAVFLSCCHFGVGLMMSNISGMRTSEKYYLYRKNNWSLIRLFLSSLCGKMDHTFWCILLLFSCIVKVNSFASHMVHGADLCFHSSQPHASFSLQDHRYGASALRCVDICSPASTCTHCAYSRRVGQAELTWVAPVLTYPDCLLAHWWSPN